MQPFLAFCIVVVMEGCHVSNKVYYYLFLEYISLSKDKNKRVGIEMAKQFKRWQQSEVS